MSEALPAQRVVACVVQRGDCFLVCQRPVHKRHGGLWEFPGGKAEAHESDRDAADRELREELGVELVGIKRPLFEITDPGSPFVIVFVPVDIRGEPACFEHSHLAWGTPEELRTFPLAPSDRAFVDYLRAARVVARSG